MTHVTQTSRHALVVARAMIGLATSWLALLLLGGQVPAGATLPAAMPALFGLQVAMAAAAALFVAGLCLVFRILDRLLVVLLAVWGVAVLAAASLSGAALYRLGNPLLLTPAGWELVVTMIAVVASGALAWATRAGTTVTNDDRTMGDMEIGVAGRPARSVAADQQPYAAYEPAYSVATHETHQGSQQSSQAGVLPSPMGTRHAQGHGAATVRISSPGRHDRSPVSEVLATADPYDRTFAALVDVVDDDTRAGASRGPSSSASGVPMHDEPATEGVQGDDLAPPLGPVPVRPGGVGAVPTALPDASDRSAPSQAERPPRADAPQRRTAGYDNAWVTL